MRARHVPHAPPRGTAGAGVGTLHPATTRSTRQTSTVYNPATGSGSPRWNRGNDDATRSREVAVHGVWPLTLQTGATATEIMCACLTLNDRLLIARCSDRMARV